MLAAIERPAKVLESCQLGKLKEAHANNDKIRAVRIGNQQISNWINRFTVNLEQRFHQKIVHGEKSRSYMGGAWNEAWGKFIGWDGNKATRIKKPEEFGNFMNQMLNTLF
ncbi:MAG: hypothetical protein WCO56_28580 [Verrucomicrobiota bacterium]